VHGFFNEFLPQEPLLHRNDSRVATRAPNSFQSLDGMACMALADWGWTVTFARHETGIEANSETKLLIP
jgi:hypothetical protein